MDTGQERYNNYIVIVFPKAKSFRAYRLKYSEIIHCDWQCDIRPRSCRLKGERQQVQLENIALPFYLMYKMQLLVLGLKNPSQVNITKEKKYYRKLNRLKIMEVLLKSSNAKFAQ